MIKRYWVHYGAQRIFFFFNDDKFFNLYDPRNETLSKFNYFIRNMILDGSPPEEYFIPHKTSRASATPEIKRDLVEVPCRYGKIIREALQYQGKRQRHYVVLKALVESVETNFVMCELPLWTENGETTGHVDLIEISRDKPPYIWIWDLKPFSSQTGHTHYTGQLEMYRVMLGQHLNVDFRNIGLGWFDDVQETTIW